MTEASEYRAHLVARISWAVSFALLWTCLFTHAWYETEFRGTSRYANVAYHKDYEGHYGLFDVEFHVNDESVTSSYSNWGKVADDAAYRMHVAKVCAVLAASLAILTGLSYTRTQFAKKDVQILTTKRMMALSLLDLLFTLITLITVGVLNHSRDFAVFCEKAGCFPVPEENLTNSTLGYSWGIWLVRFLTLLPEVCAMMYLAWTTNAYNRHGALDDEDDQEMMRTPVSTITSKGGNAEGKEAVDAATPRYMGA